MGMLMSLMLGQKRRYMIDNSDAQSYKYLGYYINKMYDVAINMIRIARKYLELLFRECGIIVGYS